MGEAQAAALARPRRDFLRKMLLSFAALQFAPTQRVTFGLSHNAKKAGFVSRAKLSWGKRLYHSLENNYFYAEFLHCSIAFLAAIILLKFGKVRHYFIKCCRFFPQEIRLGSRLTQKFFEVESYALLSLLCVSV